VSAAVKDKIFDYDFQIKKNLVGFVHDHARNISGIHNELGSKLA
jgi:hypothetical protein